jgi:hypothetical protein
MIKNLDPYIDNCFSSIQSLILRYHKSIDFHDLIKSDYEKVSIQEGAKIFELMDYNGVKIFIADESTLMAGGTFKSLEACMIIALCKKYRYNKIVFSSGANLGSALTQKLHQKLAIIVGRAQYYAAKAGRIFDTSKF